MSGTGPPPKVMIVDDTPANLTLLSNVLRERGYGVFSFPRGDLALQAATKNPPDLILLDIRMPGMNGYEVCERLKADVRLRDIPVIFISALNESINKVRAFGVGGVDYITKPFQFDEVHARIVTHLKLRDLQKQLHEYNVQLEQLVEERTHELQLAHARLKELDRVKTDFLRMLSHEMRTPLTGVLGLSDIAFRMCPQSVKVDELKQHYESARDRIMDLLDDARMLSNLEMAGEQYQPESVALGELLADARTSSALTSEQVRISFQDHALAARHVACDRHLMTRALRTILMLARKLYPASEPAELAVVGGDDRVCLEAATFPRTFPPETTSRFFDISSGVRQRSPAEGLGLAPVVAERIISLFGGQVAFVPGEGSQMRLRVEIPTAAR